jgi:hypothetical protein
MGTFVYHKLLDYRSYLNADLLSEGFKNNSTTLYKGAVKTGYVFTKVTSS